MNEFICASFAWDLCSILFGIHDGFFWHGKNPNTKYFTNPHNVLMALRIMVFVMICMAFNVNVILFLISSTLQFSCLHNGMYYTTRNWLDRDVYPRRFFAQAIRKTSTSKFTDFMTPFVRTLLYALSYLLIIFQNQILSWIKF
jgi:hypothetical protein